MEQMGEASRGIGGVDLHLHSLASDGTLAPAEVVALAARSGVRTMALTDHDTTLGVRASLEAGQEWGVEVVPGIEMTAEEGEELHILGYFIDEGYGPLQEALRYVRCLRAERAQHILRLLAQMGMPLEWAEVMGQTWSSVGRPHIARALVAHGYASHPKEAFDLYLDPGRPAYVPLPRPEAREVLGLIWAAGGVPVLAHPIVLGRDDPVERITRLDGLLVPLKRGGLVGLETYYAEYPPEVTRDLLALAEGRGLVPTGGSDFHGYNGPASPGGLAVPIDTLDKLRAAAAALRRDSRPREVVAGGAKRGA